MKILAHATYVGTTGYNSHCQKFFRKLSQYHDLKIRNFTIGKNWQGWEKINENPHGDDVSELDKKLIGLQSLWNPLNQLEDHEVYGFKKYHFIHDINIVLAEVNHYYFYHDYSGPKIAYTVWENTLYPEHFFNKLKEYDQIWVPSKWQAQITINQGIPSDKVKVVPEGVDINVFYPEDLPKNEKFTFVLFGRWDARKSTREIIQSFKNIFGNNDKVQLLISVDNPYSVDGLKTTEERLKRYNLESDNIKILHFPSREEYIKILKTAHVFLSCARSEGWNLPLIEAMACGIPSIYSNCSGQLEFAEGKGIPIDIIKEASPKEIKNSYCEMTDIAVGNWYEPNFKDLEKKMIQAFNHYDLYKNKALKHSIEIRSEFTWENAVKKANLILMDFKSKNSSEENIKKIINESSSLGDFIAWTPIVAEYVKQKNIEVNYYTPYKNLLQDSYPQINFCDYSEKLNIKDDNTISLGCFSDIPWQEMNLQEIAANILGIEYKEIRPQINNKFKKQNNFSKKYVCIATQSTAQCKYWNNPNGWQQVVDYLKSLDYEVVCIDRHENFGISSHMNSIPKNCINKTGDLPLENRINDLMHCEFFIGLGSGLSWLAWACNKPVIMISGFSDPKSEFYTAYRVHNKNVCNSCWNDTGLKFERNNWLWCPRNKDFECSREITFIMIKEKIDECIKNINQNNKQEYFNWGSTENSFSQFNHKEIFEDKIYEKFFTVEKDDIVLDLGASVGPFIYSILKNNPKKCYAVEALSNQINLLKQNLNTPVVQIIHGAITDKKNIDITWNGVTENVPTFTFEELLEKYNISKIDFLKCDCEGGEYEFFQKKNIPFLKTIPKIVVEFHLQDNAELLKYKFKWFRDKILPCFLNYKVHSIDGVDIKWDLYNDHFLDYYTEVIFYIDNR